MSGIFDMPKEAYHADNLVEVTGELIDGDVRPSLSAGIISRLVNASPLHAWAAHPKLNPDYEPEDKEAFDIGTIAHSLILGTDDAPIDVIEFDNYRTKAAQEIRDKAYAAGRVPILSRKLADIERMVERIREQLGAHKAMPPVFDEGKAEQTLVWEEDGVLCKARLDWLRDDWVATDDLKTTSRSANPSVYARNLFSVGGDIQAAWYLRGLRVLRDFTGFETLFRWVIVETSQPYAISVVSPTPAMLVIANKKIDFALGYWKQCLAADIWPGYPDEVCYAEMPAWEEERWLEKELREMAP